MMTVEKVVIVVTAEPTPYKTIYLHPIQSYNMSEFFFIHCVLCKFNGEFEFIVYIQHNRNRDFIGTSRNILLLPIHA